MTARTILIAATLATSCCPAGATWDDCLDIDSAERTAYVVTDGDSRSSCGDMGEIGLDEDNVVGFRLDGATWVVRDPAVTAEARRLFKKVGEIGAKQGAIGAKQGRLGAEQGRLGATQARVALRSTYSEEKEDPRLAEERAARMKELGERMQVLGREMEVLGKEMGREIETAQSGLSRLLAQAMRDGRAVRVRRL